MPADPFDDAAGEGEEGDEADKGLEDTGEQSAGEGDDEEGEDNEQEQDSSEEEEEDGDNEYDLTDKFIAREDEDEEEEGDASEGAKERKRRHKRRRELSAELDEEDYQLLEDNQVTGIRRKHKNERKRIRKQHDDQNKTDAQRLQEELFGADGGGGLDEEDDNQEQIRAPVEEDFGESDDEMAGFIDDDDDMGRRSGRAKARNLPQGVSSHGIQEMQDIFGDVDDLLELYAEKKAATVLADDGEEPAVPEDDQDAEALAAYEDDLERKRQQRKQKKMEAAIEPELMEKLMMLPLDDRIRDRDAPERFQVSGEADLKDAYNGDQLDDAARWIFNQLVGPEPPEEDAMDQDENMGSCKNRRARFVIEEGVIEVDGRPRDGRDVYDREELEEGLVDLSRGYRGLRKKRRRGDRQQWRKDALRRQHAIEAIVNVLGEMWNQQHEIPLIACFRKQLCGELLCLRSEDKPGFTTDRDVWKRRDAGMPDIPAGVVQAKHRVIRRWDVLWAVHDLAHKWRAIVRRKDKRQQVYRLALARCTALLEQQEGIEDPHLEELRASIQSCITAVPDASSMEDLDDIDVKFKLATSGHAVEVFEDLGPGTRRPQRSTAYQVLKKAGLVEVVKAMAMSATDFGDNLERLLKRNQPEDSRVMPMDLAYGDVRDDDPSLDKPDKVLERARHIHVSEVMSEPHVRAFIRRKLEENMTISTAPTAAGEAQLDAFHPFGSVKRLRRMPAPAFNGTDAYLRINLAEKEGLITVESEVPELERLFVKPLLDYYESSGVSAVSKEWNNLRHMILREVVQRLVPQLQEEASSRLLVEAREAVVEEYTDALWLYASLPPVQMKSEDGDVIERRRLAACCWGEGRPATCMVMLDDQGSLIDVLYLPSFSGQLRGIRPGADYNIAEDPRKASEVGRVVEFCRDNRPQAIFVGARNTNCKALKEDMSRIGDFILDAHAQILTSGHDTGTIEVCYADETIADLWANSAAAKEEFPDHPDVVRRAVALGRLGLEPLAVLASLCRPDGNEILSLNLHPLQKHVPEADLLKAAELTLITVTAQVGADINLMVSNVWQASTLPYVAGLGPRKAKSLLQAVQAKEFALNRVSLWNDIWKPGNAVFRNCGAFLKITAKAKGLVNAEVEPIDSARIEPLAYKLAFEVARAAVGGEQQNREEDVINTSKAMDYPDKVEALNLEDIHEKLAQESNDPENYNQISTLVDIAMEFIIPNMELRPGNVLEMSQMKERQFWWMVGETPETLRPGRRVEAIVRYVGQSEARCTLPEISGLDAFLSSTDISSTGPVTPSDHLKVGQSVTARVKTVKPEEFSVELTTASSDLNDDVRWEEKYFKAKNPFFHVLSHDERKAIENEKRKQARSKVLTKRTIDHPNFKNVSINEAVKLLESLPVGEAIFRPSPKSINMICLTIKLHETPEEDHLIIHRDVKEGRKRGGQLTLGTPLSILTDGNKTEEKFEDLDEILARFAEPMVERVQEIVKHRKFKESLWEDLKVDLRNEALGMPRAAVYCLAIEYRHPGFYYIASVLPTANKTPRKEYFTVSPTGFYFRHKVHSSLEKMLGVFKRNPVGENRQPPAAPAEAGPPPLQAPAQQPYAYPAGMQQQPQPFFAQPQMAGAYNAYEPAPFNPGAMYTQPTQTGYR